MNEASYLDPEAIRQQSVSALGQLGEDNAALQTALEYIDRFIENDEIQSESFRALQGQMEALFYWYNAFGQPTKKQSSELWAEYFSFHMTGNEEVMEKKSGGFGIDAGIWSFDILRYV